MINLEYIVTGTGRCGTLYMSNLLTTLGIPCSHEGIFSHKGYEKAIEIIKEGKVENSIISKDSCDNLSEFEYKIIADSSYMSAPFLSKFDAPAIHVVRNPLNVVGSFIGPYFNYFKNEEPKLEKERECHFPYEKFIYEHVPELKKEITQLDRAFLFYVRWNQMIEESKKTILFHRIEDDIEPIKNLFKYKGNNFYKNKKSNSKEKVSICVDDINNQEIKKELLEIMKRYGYV